MDTATAVNVLSEKMYQALKHASCGGWYHHKPNDLNLRGVIENRPEILGIVCLPVNLGKGTATMHLDFYIVKLWVAF